MAQYYLDREDCDIVEVSIITKKLIINRKGFDLSPLFEEIEREVVAKNCDEFA
jgi:hypothetical protein